MLHRHLPDNLTASLTPEDWEQQWTEADTIMHVISRQVWVQAMCRGLPGELGLEPNHRAAVRWLAYIFLGGN
jgi:hypothetical protein